MIVAEPSGDTRTPIEIVIASSNPGKVTELRDLLGDGFQLTTAEANKASLPEETGTTFFENAILKARSVCEQTSRIAIADDSGLEVDALSGAPGVHSARYAGNMATDADNRHKLLHELSGMEAAQRTARFVSVIAIAFGPDDIVTADGMCEGSIAFEERGEGGFGYDSIFELESGQTMAQIDPVEKNRISHRGMAMKRALSILEDRLGHDQEAQG